jgi:glycosyltransferase involved in cell wall biosynthesis
LVLIPSYNSGPLLAETVAAARAAWSPVWVVVDGSTDGSDALLPAEAPGFRVLRLPRNRGKGGAVLAALEQALVEGFSHALVMDSDGQHPPGRIAAFMAASAAAPGAMVLGRPLFGRDAPLLRVYWRRVSNLLCGVETLGAGIADSLFGFRVYPIAPLLRAMGQSRFARRFDFDPEVAVRLCWLGVRPLALDAPVRYPARADGGISHFRYGRDNLLLAFMHLRLLGGLLVRLPTLLARRFAPP